MSSNNTDSQFVTVLKDYIKGIHYSKFKRFDESHDGEPTTYETMERFFDIKVEYCGNRQDCLICRSALMAFKDSSSLQSLKILCNIEPVLKQLLFIINGRLEGGEKDRKTLVFSQADLDKYPELTLKPIITQRIIKYRINERGESVQDVFREGLDLLPYDLWHCEKNTKNWIHEMRNPIGYNDKLEIIGDAHREQIIKALPQNRQRIEESIHIMRAYALRNDDAHMPQDEELEKNADEIVKDFVAVIMLACEKYSKRINNVWQETVGDRGFDIDDYLYNIVSRYESSPEFTDYVDLTWEKSSFDGRPADYKKIDELCGLIAKKTCNSFQLVGTAGMGKSTALHHMEYLLAKRCMKDKSSPLPIAVGVMGCKTPTDLLNKISESLGNREIFRKILNTGSTQICLICDALNEAEGGIENQRYIVQTLEKLLDSTPAITLVLSNRDSAGIDSSIIEENEWVLSELGDIDIYLQFFRNTPKHIQERALRVLKADGGDKSITWKSKLQTPLMVKWFREAVSNTDNEKQITPEGFVFLYLHAIFCREIDEKQSRDVEYLYGMLTELRHKLDVEKLRLETRTEYVTVLEKTFPERMQRTNCIKLAIGMGILQESDDGTITFPGELRYVFGRYGTFDELCRYCKNKLSR